MRCFVDWEVMCRFTSHTTCPTLWIDLPVEWCFPYVNVITLKPQLPGRVGPLTSWKPLAQQANAKLSLAQTLKTPDIPR